MNRYIMCCSMGENIEEGISKRVGLFKSHAYTLIGCYEVDIKKGKKEKLVKIRNPHG